MKGDRQPTIDAVTSTYGAPMGRRDWLPCGAEKKSVRVFRVVIDPQGYDVGGAYWGTGQPLYCATDGADYREFVRARHRMDAIHKLNIELSLLVRVPKHYGLWLAEQP